VIGMPDATSDRNKVTIFLITGKVNSHTFVPTTPPNLRGMVFQFVLSASSSPELIKKFVGDLDAGRAASE